jgi:preprotein translocase subunit SecG
VAVAVVVAVVVAVAVAGVIFVGQHEGRAGAARDARAELQS